MNQMKMAKAERRSTTPSLHHLEVKKAENGGHIISHHFDVTGGSEYHPPEDHVFAPSEGMEALHHIAEAADIKINEKEASSDEQESERGAASAEAEEGEE